MFGFSKQKIYNMKFNIQSLIIISTFSALVACGSNTQGIANTQQLKSNNDENEKLFIVQVFKENEHLPMNERIELFYKLKKEDVVKS